jgi:hypothetical protein
MLALSPARQTLLLFLLALAVLIPGIWEATGLTGKDEFFLGLRTPMEMIEGNHWLVPFLDGAPRIRKPPLLYWVGRSSYEIFGISLVSARIIGVLAAALLIIAAPVFRGFPRRTRLIAGCILLGCLGIASEGRRFMLDMPVAALSTAAFWSLLVWLKNRRFFQLTVTSLLLVAGFMTKGPIVALVFGGGCLALLLVAVHPGRHWKRCLVTGYSGHCSPCPGFLLCGRLPEATNLVLADELESPIFSIFPGIRPAQWPALLFALCGCGLLQRSRTWETRFALFWFLVTFLPFLFIKSFDRYLIGSLVPLSIFLAMTLPQVRVRWPFRLGMLLALGLGGVLAGFAFWFQLGGWYWLVLPAIYLGWAWWHERALAHTLAAPAVYWIALLAGVFPALGINAVPASVIELGRSQSIAMFDGPQPAMLPILTAQAHRHYGKLDKFDLSELAASKTPIFVEEKDISSFKTALTVTNHQATQLGSYQTLASHGSGLRFARVGATSNDWKSAVSSRSLAPLLTTVFWFEVSQP